MAELFSIFSTISSTIESFFSNLPAIFSAIFATVVGLILFFRKQVSEGIVKASQWIIRKISSRKAEKLYRKGVQKSYGKIPVFGERQQKPIDEIYTSLNLLKEPVAFEQYDIEGIRREFLDRSNLYTKLERRNGLEIVKEGKDLFVFGKPGAGKTTFLKHIAVKAAQLQLSTTKTKSPVPVFISLHLHSRKEQSIIEAIQNELKVCGLSKTDSSIESFLNSGRVLNSF